MPDYCFRLLLTTGAYKIIIAHVLRHQPVGDLDDAVGLLRDGAVVRDDDEGGAQLVVDAAEQLRRPWPCSCVSRLPVGSSASRMSGEFMRARPMATRCFCPPESWSALLSARPPSPRNSRISSARCWPSRCSARHPLPDSWRQGGAADPRGEEEVLPDGELGQQVVELEHETQVARCERRPAPSCSAPRRPSPAACTVPWVGRVEQAQHVEERRLAAAGLPDDGEELLLLHAEATRRAGPGS